MTTAFASATPAAPSALPAGPWRRAWRRLRRRRSAMAGLAVVLAFIVPAPAAAWIAPQDPIATSWGSMLNTAKNYVDNAPWMAVWPGTAIFLLVLAFNLLGDGLRDALDPRQV